MTDYRHNNQYYWHLPEVTSIKSNFRMIVCWTSCNFQGKMCIPLHNRQKIYKTFHFSSIFYCFLCGPLIRSHSKNEVTQKGEKGGWVKQNCFQIEAFLEVYTKFENTNNLLFSVLLLCTRLESISNREERRPFCELLQVL